MKPRQPSITARSEPQKQGDAAMSHTPYIMPDGRPLGQFLQETQADSARSKRSEQKTRRNRKADREGGWTQRAAVRPTAPQADAGEAEDESIRLGRDRRRRFLNEKILRDMAGALTVADMEALFKPVPFGESHVSPLMQATAPDVLPIWDLFRNIDEDKQNRTLQKWEAHLNAQKHGRSDGETSSSGSTATHVSGLTALRSWATIPKRAREALKRCSPAFVEELEQPILQFLDKQGEDTDLELELEDSYQRLMVHGIATFHSLQSATAQGLTSIRHGRSSTNDSCSGSPAISCADIIFALSANPPGGLTAELLDAQWRRMTFGTDADSEVSYVVV